MRNASRAALVAAIVCVSPFTAPVSARADTALVFSNQSFDDALASNRGEKVLVVMFSAKWCGPCKAMEHSTWTDPGVAAWVKDHGVALHVDVDEHKLLADRFDVRSLPLLIAFKNGQVVERSLGFKDADGLKRWLQGAASLTPSATDPVTHLPPAAPVLTTTTTVIAQPPSATSAKPVQTLTTETRVIRPNEPQSDIAAPKREKPAAVDPCKRVQTEHTKLRDALETGKDLAAKNAARRKFRSAVGKIYAAELKANRPSSAIEVQVLATELDDTGWMRLALVQSAIEAGQRPPALTGLLDQAQAKGVDVRKIRAKLVADAGAQ